MKTQKKISNKKERMAKDQPLLDDIPFLGGLHVLYMIAGFFLMAQGCVLLALYFLQGFSEFPICEVTWTPRTGPATVGVSCTEVELNVFSIIALFICAFSCVAHVLVERNRHFWWLSCFCMCCSRQTVFERRQIRPTSDFSESLTLLPGEPDMSFTREAEEKEHSQALTVYNEYLQFGRSPFKYVHMAIAFSFMCFQAFAAIPVSTPSDVVLAFAGTISLFVIMLAVDKLGEFSPVRAGVHRAVATNGNMSKATLTPTDVMRRRWALLFEPVWWALFLIIWVSPFAQMVTQDPPTWVYAIFCVQLVAVVGLWVAHAYQQNAFATLRSAAHEAEPLITSVRKIFSIGEIIFLGITFVVLSFQAWMVFGFTVM